jgi:hypothetical protein
MQKYQYLGSMRTYKAVTGNEPRGPNTLYRTDAQLRRGDVIILETQLTSWSLPDAGDGAAGET